MQSLRSRKNSEYSIDIIHDLHSISYHNIIEVQRHRTSRRSIDDHSTYFGNRNWVSEWSCLPRELACDTGRLWERKPKRIKQLGEKNQNIPICGIHVIGLLLWLAKKWNESYLFPIRQQPASLSEGNKGRGPWERETKECEHRSKIARRENETECKEKEEIENRGMQVHRRFLSFALFSHTWRCDLWAERSDT